jgi:biotin carboxyl carrier protein
MRRYTLAVNGKPVSLEVRELAGGRYQVSLGGPPLEVELVEESEPPAAPAPDTPAASRTLTAPMPGTVLAVEVAPGAAVRRGDLLLTLEAMKMANPIRAPRDGVVAEVAVSAGQQVAYGDALLRLEG